MEDLSKSFIKKFVNHDTNDWKLGGDEAEEILNFIRQREKELLSEIKTGAVIGGTENIYSVPIGKINEKIKELSND